MGSVFFKFLKTAVLLCAGLLVAAVPRTAYPQPGVPGEFQYNVRSPVPVQQQRQRQRRQVYRKRSGTGEAQSAVEAPEFLGVVDSKTGPEVMSRLACQISTSDDGYNQLVCYTYGRSKVEYYGSYVFDPRWNVRFWSRIKVSGTRIGVSRSGYFQVYDNGTCHIHLSVAAAGGGTRRDVDLRCSTTEFDRGFTRVRTTVLYVRNRPVMAMVVRYQGLRLTGGCLVQYRARSQYIPDPHVNLVVFGEVPQAQAAFKALPPGASLQQVLRYVCYR